MCIAAVALNEHPDYPVIIIDNRDEDPKRATNECTVLPSNIICAVDLVHESKHSTWCGCNAGNGNFCVLTNVATHLHANLCGLEPPATPLVQAKVSRGILVANLLKDIEYKEHLEPSHYADYDGYNLLFGSLLYNATCNEQPHLYYTSNRRHDANNPEPVTLQTVHSLQDGVHCMSNSFLNDDSWPKVKFLKSALKQTIQQVQHGHSPSIYELRDLLAELLCARPSFPVDQLPHHVQHLLDVYKQLLDSSVIVNNDDSGNVNGNNNNNNNNGDTNGQLLVDNKLTREEIVDAMEDVLEGQQNIFVNAKLGKTRAQTIVLVHKSGTIHYFYRNTDSLIPPKHLMPSVLDKSTPQEILDKSTPQEVLEMRNFASSGWSEFVVKPGNPV